MKKRRNIVQAYLTDEELSIFQSLVMQSGIKSQSEFIRQKIFQENLNNNQFNDELIFTLKRIFKETYIAKKLVSACLQELTKEQSNYKELILRFIKEIEKEFEFYYEEEEK